MQTDLIGDCILWDKYRDKKSGYGIASVRGKLVKAHRLAWESANGPIPAGLFVLHRCDNPPCVNPEHLFVGTQTDNMRDCRDKGRNKYPDTRGTKHGMSKLSDDDVRKIRGMAAASSQQAIARHFGISQERVHSVLHGRAWSHVDGETEYKPLPPLKGEQNGNTKISEMAAVRLKMLRGVLSSTVIARAIGLSRVQVCNIMRGVSWKHVTASTRYKF